MTPKTPGPRIDPESVAAKDILEARLGSLLEAYPMVDYVWLWEDEGMSWASQKAERAAFRHALQAGVRFPEAPRAREAHGDFRLGRSGAALRVFS